MAVKVSHPRLLLKGALPADTRVDAAWLMGRFSRGIRQQSVGRRILMSLMAAR